MKRRNFIANSAFVVLGSGFVGCAQDPGAFGRPGQARPGQAGGRGFGGMARGPSDIKSLSTILQRANCPLTEGQVNFLLTLNEGPEFTKRMVEVLDELQIKVIEDNSGGGRRGGGGGRRR